MSSGPAEVAWIKCQRHENLLLKTPLKDNLVNGLGNNLNLEGAMNTVSQVNGEGMFPKLSKRAFDMDLLLVENDLLGSQKICDMHGGNRAKDLVVLADFDGNRKNEL